MNSNRGGARVDNNVGQVPNGHAAGNVLGGDFPGYPSGSAGGNLGDRAGVAPSATAKGKLKIKLVSSVLTTDVARLVPLKREAPADENRHGPASRRDDAERVPNDPRPAAVAEYPAPVSPAISGAGSPRPCADEDEALPNAMGTPSDAAPPAFEGAMLDGGGVPAANAANKTVGRSGKSKKGAKHSAKARGGRNYVPKCTGGLWAPKKKELHIVAGGFCVFINEFYIPACPDRKDDYGFFLQPVDTSVVTDYLSVVKEPMDFGTMKAKASAKQYRMIEEFHVLSSVRLCSVIVDGIEPFWGLAYNSPQTAYHRYAEKIGEYGRLAILREGKNVMTEEETRQERSKEEEKRRRQQPAKKQQPQGGREVKGGKGKRRLAAGSDRTASTPVPADGRKPWRSQSHVTYDEFAGERRTPGAPGERSATPSGDLSLHRHSQDPGGTTATIHPDLADIIFDPAAELSTLCVSRSESVATLLATNARYLQTPRTHGEQKGPQPAPLIKAFAAALEPDGTIAAIVGGSIVEAEKPTGKPTYLADCSLAPSGMAQLNWWVPADYVVLEWKS
ncbi:MAG: hypothetical protein BJ554DRAFT_488 [Olpidium bornovanus]|uniref:Bromo domain-containing protein n=1 Tax=Olpidium bornovanus TaxID=278681 RepID=A0A8H7ZTL1_9FUNG|nr:MAG: hypothetical protein BJ554DRAFT_488 [Olpidium bornovanus]